MSEPHFNIVLFQPEIPTNTGNIGRLCVASHCKLHLIGPMGFSIDEKQVRRAGLDYWVHLDHQYYENFEQFLQANDCLDRVSFFTTKAEQSLFDKKFSRGDWLMFGPETRGLPEELFKSRAAQSYRIPMFGQTRSLNLANSVSIVAYEGIRQLGLL
ncbi:MAG: tRNA (cytidine(34)-2'-O)-methyltransferase [Bdellovibrionales bacterium]|nr:tRNA (cytidine(34)-2'-O)-methyltransferase [Bdellovibrionales bacterium]